MVGADGWPTTNSTVRRPASPVWTRLVTIISSRRGYRSASAPPIGLKNAIGRNAAAATVPVHAAWLVCFGDVDAERDRLHPRADVRHERARPQPRVRGVAQRRERDEPLRAVARRRLAATASPVDYVVGHCGFRFSRNARHALVRVVGLRVVDHHRAREAVRGALVDALLLVERALAEREHRRARLRDPLGELDHRGFELGRPARPGSRGPTRRRWPRRSSRR